MLEPRPRRAYPTWLQQSLQLRADLAGRVRKSLGDAGEFFLHGGALGEDAGNRAHDLLRDQIEAAAPLFHAARKVLRGDGQRIGKESALERGADDVVLQWPEADIAGEIALEIANALPKGDGEQPPHAGSVQLARLLRRIEHLQRDRIARVNERRIADQRLHPAADLEDLGQLAHRPAGVAFAFRNRRLVLQERLRLLAE